MAPTESKAPKGPFRLMHTMLRVDNIDRAIDFYTRQLGMKLIWRREHEAARFTNALIGYGSEALDPALEFFQAWEPTADSKPAPKFGHVAVEVRDLPNAYERLAQAGVTVTSPPRVSSRGDMLMAFIEDPDGYCIELLEVITG